MYQSKMKSEETDHLFKAILSLKTEEECYRFFDDLCTFSEIEAMSQRFEVASLLADGKTFTQISQRSAFRPRPSRASISAFATGRTAISCCSSGPKKKSKPFVILIRAGAKRLLLFVRFALLQCRKGIST